MRPRKSADTLVLLPGLGADSRLFSSQIAEFPAMLTPPWPGIDPGDSITDLARKLGEGLAGGGRMIVGGFSFGGMVALEMAALESLRDQVAGVVLLAGIQRPSAIADDFRAKAGQLRWIPASALGFGLKHLAGSFAKDEPITAAQRDVLRQMASQINLRFFRWAVKQCADWTFDRRRVKVPVRHIHGRHDKIVPPYEPDVDVWLDAGHLIQFTHAQQVNAEIARFAAEIGLDLRAAQPA
ncbi:MAG: alpha/beta hydrolase [Fimbriimonadaceae bacterium]